MKNFLQAKLLPVSALTAILFLSGCDASSNKTEEAETSDQAAVTQTEKQSGEADNQERESSNQADLKSGNFFYIARDVADVQLKAGDYIAQLQQSQENLQQALDTKDIQQLESTVTALKSQLTGFNQALDQLNLKSSEIDNIRQNIQTANEQALKSPLLNGQVDFSQVDFNKIEQQLGSVQSEMLKLAAMLIPKSGSSSDTDTIENKE